LKFRICCSAKFPKGAKVRKDCFYCGQKNISVLIRCDNIAYHL